MKAPTLKETAALSLLLHAFVFFIFLSIVKRTSHFTLPSPYTVRLISPKEVALKKSGASARAQAAKVKEIKRKRQSAMMKTKKVLAKKAPVEKEKDVATRKEPVPSKMATVREKIAALEAKKRIEKIVELRRAVLSVKKVKKEDEIASVSEGKIGDEGSVPVEGSLIASYYRLVQERVWSEWVYPDFGSQQRIEAIVNVKIMKDGQIEIRDLTKSSDNPLFDRSVLRAIAKASPLPPPPHDLDISLRFSP
jgi:colicin import membrane protein